MSYQAIREYLLAIVDRYQHSDKRGKTVLLNEAVHVTRLSRKHLIRVLKQPKTQLARKKTSGRPRRYPKALLEPHVQYLWIQMERISAARLKAGFSDWLPFYRHSELTPQLRLFLEQMSVSTLERMLRAIRGSLTVKRGLSTTCPARFMKNKVPLNTFDAKIDRPGFCQADTVAHCGASTQGQYLNTITLTDIDSTWTENRAIYSKKAHEVRKQFAEFDHTLPFELLAVNIDNGTEFLNTLMINFMRGENGKKPIHFTRSRAYRKNDNCYVEQKNYTHVRELFGYERMEESNLSDLMNEIYKKCWNPLQNFFIPTFKLKEKIRIGSQIKKKFDAPRTPYDRLINSPHLSEERKERLKNMKAELNPFKLKSDLEAKLKIFFDRLRKSKIREAS